MVPRANHLEILEELAALREDREADLEEVTALESEFSFAWEQLQKAVAEAAEMRSTLSEMVPRSELEAAKAECEALRAHAYESTRSAEELELRLSTAELQGEQMRSKIKVGTASS
jgi:uncharacterized coiled-coil DUF342 family protein